ncbi:TorF family putative porin [Massilia sp. MB5]|uniref:TorF family putative porin n=1 Tax=Massilia sp. MB5 TaxID=2919578 RepID=UPI001F0D5EB6|nr:TorF family putative porin [Massilia sp. MB5]UMR29738.1 TorF family putative porin [Massilia sp. MB5]
MVMLASACLVGAAPAASAQVSGSIAYASDYRFRGMSLSDGRASLQFGLAYDGRDGWYAGALLAGTRLDAGRTGQHLLAYGGYAQRLANGLVWELGSSRSAFSQEPGYGYGELYAGLAGERLGMRLYYSPNYFGRGTRTLYAEINATLALHRQVNFLVHLGHLHSLSGPSYPQRYDASAGLVFSIGQCALQVTHSHSALRHPTYASSVYRADRTSVRASWSF